MKMIWIPFGLDTLGKSDEEKEIMLWLNNNLFKDRYLGQLQLYIAGETSMGKTWLLNQLDRFCRIYWVPMNEDFYDVAQVLMMPELTSAIPQWLPKLKPELLGCSSLMHLNHKKEVVHHRILDFPLKGSYDTLERAVLYEFKNSPRILGFGSIGMPYPSITLTYLS